MSVNLSALSAILTEDAALVRVQFKASSNKTYTYKVPMTWNVVAGDTLIVVSPYCDLESGFTAVDVISVQDYLDLDLDASFTYKWAVSKVDKWAYEERLMREEAFLEDIRRTRLRTRKREAMAQLTEGLSGSELLEVERAVGRLNGKQYPQAQQPTAPKAPEAPRAQVPAAFAYQKAGPDVGDGGDW